MCLPFAIRNQFQTYANFYLRHVGCVNMAAAESSQWSAYHLSEWPGWDYRSIMVRIFLKSVNQPNEIALTIWNSISRRNFFRLMRDWKLENLRNGKDISVVSFRTEKEDYLWRYSTISERNFRKITFPFGFKPKFRIFWPNGMHPCFPVCKLLL